MRVLLLTHKTVVPPREIKPSINPDNQLWRTEYYVASSLARMGHDVRFCGVDNSLRPLKKTLGTYRPDVVFNLLEEFAGEGILDFFVVTYLEKIRQPYTGCNSVGLILSKNKIVTKILLSANKIKTPSFEKYPKLVKFVDEDSSFGITDASIVHNGIEEKKQIARLKKISKARTFCEQYIDGRELHVAVITRNKKPRATPVWETTFGSKRGPSIISEKVKWDFDFRKKMNIELKPVTDLDSQLTNKIQKIAVRSYQKLELTGFARVDIRMDSQQNIYVLEVNPNPDVAQGDEFAECVRSSGLSYDELIESLVKEALL
jgi:D-alanine-D-alanine ligase